MAVQNPVRYPACIFLIIPPSFFSVSEDNRRRGWKEKMLWRNFHHLLCDWCRSEQSDPKRLCVVITACWVTRAHTHTRRAAAGAGSWNVFEMMFTCRGCENLRDSTETRTPQRSKVRGHLPALMWNIQSGYWDTHTHILEHFSTNLEQVQRASHSQDMRRNFMRRPGHRSTQEHEATQTWFHASCSEMCLNAIHNNAMLHSQVFLFQNVLILQQMKQTKIACSTN